MSRYISVLARRAAKWDKLVDDKTFIPKSAKGKCDLNML